jgi:hypothetical protein
MPGECQGDSFSGARMGGLGGNWRRFNLEQVILSVAGLLPDFQPSPSRVQRSRAKRVAALAPLSLLPAQPPAGEIPLGRRCRPQAERARAEPSPTRRATDLPVAQTRPRRRPSRNPNAARFPSESRCRPRALTRRNPSIILRRSTRYMRNHDLPPHETKGERSCPSTWEGDSLHPHPLR